MNAQQQPLTSQTQSVSPVASSGNIVSFLAPLMNGHGEITFEGIDFSKKIQAYQEVAERNNCNLINFAESILSQIPAGTSVVPIPVIPRITDCWSGSDAQKMKLKPGHVMPTAVFIIRLGNLQGCLMNKVFDGVVIEENTGTEVYRVLYDAYYVLPSGVMISVQGEGKDQNLYNTVTDPQTGVVTKKRQSDIAESTRKKARRNAIKNLNNIPTSMPQEDFLRPWVILRPIFRPGISAETDQIIAEQKALTRHSVKMLYGGATEEGSPVIDTVAEPSQAKSSGPSVERLQETIKKLSTVAELNQLGKDIAEMTHLDDSEKSQLRVAYEAQKALIKESTY